MTVIINHLGANLFFKVSARNNDETKSFPKIQKLRKCLVSVLRNFNKEVLRLETEEPLKYIDYQSSSP